MNEKRTAGRKMSRREWVILGSCIRDAVILVAFAWCMIVLLESFATHL